MKSNRLMLLELDQITTVQPGGVTERLLLRSLWSLVGAIRERFTDLLKSAPPGATSFQLSITVTAIGEQIGLELSTSTEQPGASSPMNHSAQDSFPSELDLSKEMGSKVSESLTQPFDPDYQHSFMDNPANYGNCRKCAMPRTSFQHYYMLNGKIQYIGQTEWLAARNRKHPEARPFA